MSDSPLHSPKNIQNYIFGIILALLFLAVCRLFAPFFTLLLWSILLYVLISPLHHWVVRKLDFSKPRGVILKTVWAALFAIGTVALILIPLSLLGFQLFSELMELVRFGRDAFAANPDFLKDFFLSDAFVNGTAFIRDLSAGVVDISAGQIQQQIVSLLGDGIQGLARASSNLVLNVGGFLLSLVFMVFCLFFFYVDGDSLARLALRAVPIRKEYLNALVVKFKDITRNLVLGYIMVSLIQTVLAYIIFLIFQVKGALVFAALVFICVFIPMIGGGLVWLPLGIARIAQGDTLGGIIFLAVSGLFISTLDNFLRPLFLRDRIQLHPLIIFFSILGGLRVFGFNGLVLGPMVVILFLTVLDLFLAEHKIE
jgi:predicted PurR-regulated permease PerM